MTRKLLMGAVAAVALAASYGGAAVAAPITPSPTITVAGLPGATFNTFTCSISEGGLINSPDACGQINVAASPLNNGIEFSSSFHAALDSFDDATLSYHVTSVTPISGIDLSFNGTFQGLAIASVTESVFDALTNNLVGFLSVSCGIGGCNLTDPTTGYVNLTGGSYTSLIVEKDIKVNAGLILPADISIVDQSFHFVATPEPASMALLGAGLAGLGFVRRSRRQG